jgi:uncharacterized protein (DUF924 family)
MELKPDVTDEVLMFWFGTPNIEYAVKKQELWFKATPQFDKSISKKFTEAYEAAAANKFDNLIEDQSGCLALIILLDQIPRNLFRHSAKAYATDSKARSIARRGLQKDYDKNMSAWHRVFFYLPFEHSENIDDQNLSVQLFKNLAFENVIESAIDHKNIIKKFGRFPYRNKDLGRISTPEEKEYLKNPPPWGKTKAEFDELETKKTPPKNIV